jgi:steroid 5-alpha reductase family enzyme
MIHWLLTGLGVAVAYFFLTWIISVRIRNYGLLDVAWSYGVAILAPIYALSGPGDGLRKMLFTVIGTAWSLRLGTYILLRVLRHHPKEDVRYEALRKQWPGPGMFLAFFQLQALIVVVFSIPFLLAAWNAAPLAIIEYAGLGIALAGLLGEALADDQMKSFKASPANEGKVCQAGLWRYSRHPNYFFEFLVWVGFFIASLGTPWGWTTLACPVLMYHFLTKVTGIPLTEEYALKSKGEAYREYQRTTSAFFPWFRKAIPKP